VFAFEGDLVKFENTQDQERIMQIRGEYLVEISPNGGLAESGFRFCFDIKF
jgi:hypothetical protein